ncbi:MAG: hypothetical protein IKL68_05695 [Clostridia bacterium]|nr:hypothetical protein [Clostridia bacterium]
MKKLKILAIACALLMTTNVHAALQSRPGGTATSRQYASVFFKLAREMEASGGALGLSATFAEKSKAYEETSVANGIDSHMCKNTEWGAAAMLAASNYGAGAGNVKTDYNSSTKMYGVTASTTGNMTGIFGLNGGAASYEYVSAGIVSKMIDGYNRYIANAAPRYVDKYSESDTNPVGADRFIPGDATYETRKLPSGSTNWVSNSRPIGLRTDGLFSIMHYTGIGDSGEGIHICVWVGDGI